jgi:NDP-sugar pyrophosphorylase family protein
VDAIVLVGGLGTRLRPLSPTRHKSLVPVCNRPAIGYLCDWLRRSGIDRAVLALGQRNEEFYTRRSWIPDNGTVASRRTRRYSTTAMTES